MSSDSKILKRDKMREKRKKQSLKNEEERLRKLEYNAKNNPLRPSTKSSKIITINSDPNAFKTRLRKNVSNLTVDLTNSNIPANRYEVEECVRESQSCNENILREVLNQPAPSTSPDILNKSRNCDENDFNNVSSLSNEPAALSNQQSKNLNVSNVSNASVNQAEISDDSKSKEKRYIRTLLAREQRLYRRIRQLEAVVGEKNKMIHKWTVRCSRMQKTISGNSSSKNELLNSVKSIEKQGPSAVRERLLYCEVLDQQLQNKKKSITEEKDRIVFQKMLSGPVVKENKSMEKLSHLVSLKSQRKYMNSESLTGERLSIKANQRRSEISQIITKFFESDENSSIAPGVKDTITHHSVKKRKRYLCDTVDNLFTKFKKQHPSIKISRAAFYKYKPFWLVHRPINGRDTCLCKTHANMKFLLLRLSNHKVLNNPSSQSFIESRVCNAFHKECCYRECKNCKDKKLNIRKCNDRTSYFKWVTREESRLGAKGKMYDVKITSKVKIDSTVDGLITEANNLADDYLKHEYLRIHQQRAISTIRDSLKPNEAFFTADFSQNWICKYAAEIQSAHFGASKKQLSLHTGAFYYKNTKGDLEWISCCTVSECLRHDAAGVWTHLQPILKLIRETLPELSAIHFQTDGPSSQYRNKTCFHLFQQFCVKMDLNYATWNFTAPGHGKSVADGTGGTIKGLCDRAVALGKDILTAEEMVNQINSSSKVKAFTILEDDFKIIDQMTNSQIVAAPGTTKIYQLIWLKQNQNALLLNELSCSYCYAMGLYESCRHFSLSPHSWIPAEKVISNKKRTAQNYIGEDKSNKTSTKILKNNNQITLEAKTEKNIEKNSVSKPVDNTRQRKRYG